MQPERGSPAYEALDSHAAPRKKLRIAFTGVENLATSSAPLGEGMPEQVTVQQTTLTSI